MADAPGDRSKAHIYHWVHAKGNINQAMSILESEKKALENRIWYLYPNQAGSIWEGDGREPSVTARVLDDGTRQADKAEYNAQGQVTKRTDPVGRETAFEYDANGIDLLRVKQKNGAGYDLLETRTYNAQHESLTVTDAAGQPTTYTYNAAGQVETVTNAKNETTTYAHTSGKLTSITEPVVGVNHPGFIGELLARRPKLCHSASPHTVSQTRMPSACRRRHLNVTASYRSNSPSAVPIFSNATSALSSWTTPTDTPYRRRRLARRKSHRLYRLISDLGNAIFWTVLIVDEFSRVDVMGLVAAAQRSLQSSAMT